MAIGAIIAGIAAALPGVGTGIQQIIQSNQNKKRGQAITGMSTDEWKKQMGAVDYTIPEGYGEYKDYQKQLLGLSGREQMPGQDAMRQDINASGATALSGAQNLGGADAAAVLLGVNQDRQKSLRQLGIMSSQYQSQQQNQARQNYGQAIGMGAQYEDKAFDYNTWLPQQMKWNQAMDYQNLATQQAASGFDQFSGGVTQGANIWANQQYYNSMQPQQPQGAQQGATPGTGSMNSSWQPKIPSNYGQDPNG